MKLAYPEMEHVLQFNCESFQQLIIENQNFFRRIVEDIVCQSEGADGDFILSEDDTPIPIAKNVELISQFIPFSINRKTLLTKVLNAMEKTSVDCDFYQRTSQLMADLERLVDDISFSLPGALESEKMLFSNVLKAIGIRFRDDYDSLAEKILDYMELVHGYEGKKLFVLVNLRSYLDDDTMELFTKTALAHGNQLLLIDNRDCKKLSLEKRCIIDSDLCEI